MVTPAEPTSEPDASLSDPHELLSAYLDYYRATLLRKLDGLPERELRSSRLPSGWTPLELLKHLAYVERRWLRWGFTGEPVDAPWGDEGADGRWHVAADESAEAVRALYADVCEDSRRIVAGASLGQISRSGGRFNPPDTHPALIWILLHLLQEYARHIGHLDVVRELADGMAGE
ncbi:MAG: DinB family protein [Micromonosporaceae bacterium]